MSWNSYIPSSTLHPLFQTPFSQIPDLNVPFPIFEKIVLTVLLSVFPWPTFAEYVAPVNPIGDKVVGLEYVVEFVNKYCLLLPEW